MITIELDEEACSFALNHVGPDREGASLQPPSRAVVAQARRHSERGNAFREVTCTYADARDMLDWFQTAADMLTVLDDARAVVCARAADAIRTQLGLAGR